MLQKLQLRVHKHWLFVLAGIMWTAVGIMLLGRAYGWLLAIAPAWAIPLGSVSLGLGFIAYRFGFIHTVHRNIERLCQLPEKVSLFAFNSPKGYAIIIFMIALGITLRSSSIPRPYLAFLYTVMGGALFFASFHFYGQFWHSFSQREPCSAPKTELSGE